VCGVAAGGGKLVKSAGELGTENGMRGICMHEGTTTSLSKALYD
jgi:hypothetical protein